jgi:Carboxypeptidase regulatory-like domain
MKKKSLLDSIEVPKPCDKSWNEMIGGDVSRFCLHCEKEIYNISAMTHQEAKKLLFQSKERVCIRMEREPDGRIKTLKKQLHQITRQMPLAAGVLTASLILAGATNAQETKVETSKITITQIADKNSKPTISGVITDSNGAIVAGVRIILRNTKDNSTRFANSNDSGFYEFKDVEVSTYEIEIVEQNGFKKFIQKDLSIENNTNLELRIALSSGDVVIGQTIYHEDPNIKTETPQIDTKITPRQIESLPIKSRNLPVLGLFPGVKEEKPRKQLKMSQISFTVVDQNDALVVNAKIILKNGKLKKEYSIFSNDEGLAKLDEILAGDYKVEITANGFKKYKGKIKIKETTENEIKITLETGNEVVGVFISNH